VDWGWPAKPREQDFRIVCKAAGFDVLGLLTIDMPLVLIFGPGGALLKMQSHLFPTAEHSRSHDPRDGITVVVAAARSSPSCGPRSAVVIYMRHGRDMPRHAFIGSGGADVS